jgi:T5orf172 domain
MKVRPGYLYVLTHPSDPELFKVGVTIQRPEVRLAQHNSQLDKAAGKVVARTGQKWELKIVIEVPDVYHAERKFWGATHWPEITGTRGVEVLPMKWELVQRALEAAAKTGVRPPEPVRPKRDSDWLRKQLQGTGIMLTRPYRGLLTHVEFRCAEGHVFNESPGLLVHKKSCPCCLDWGVPWGYRAGVRASLRQDDASEDPVS